ncbi:hypothetical protein HJC23_007479 [Cyclotella cryptica]|uniref:G-protein coupled receptors family 1 profile domain-containing protein n=1 Tax=Cyclotella cryptica TaxID=29204 RepID=A0ABD3NTX4_9STRA
MWTATASNNSKAIDFSTVWQKCAVQNGTDSWMICPNGMLCPFLRDDELTGFWALGCMRCPGVSNNNTTFGDDCPSAVHNLGQMFIDADIIPEYNEEDLLNMCIRACAAGREGEPCSQNQPCTPGSSFCDYSLSDSGSCQECPLDVDECYQEGFVSTELGKKECVKCSLECVSLSASQVASNGKEIPSNAIDAITSSMLEFNVTGSLKDCSGLILDEVDVCEGAAGHICLVEDYTFDTLFWQLTDKAEKSGCLAVIMFADYENFPDNEPCRARHSYDQLDIPFVCISYDEGTLLMKEHIDSESITDVSTNYLGLMCFADFPRWCEHCTEDPLFCYFDPVGGFPRTPEFISSCVESCNAEVSFGRCKFCPNALTGSNLMGGSLDIDAGHAQCSFCPNNDVLYRHRKVPLFGTEISCWQMQAFFQRIKYSEDSVNCKLSQSFNHICGCTGTEYAGANSTAKQAALVWLPRVMAVLSIMGSCFIIYDTTRVRERRSKLLYQLLITLSIFDILGSIAYAFTSLPTPVEDYIYGSKGNDATCIAQGFFIQLGTTACFINSSLSVYYYMTIIHGCSEDALKKKRFAFFVPPILVGLSFAFAGIPWYYDMLIWCNNTGNWWPEIPVIISIVLATAVMGAVCVGVFKTERASRRYSSNANTISIMVVKQSLLFIGAFYIAWVPYLALQFMWASGRAFSSYGFVLFAASSVPLQGFLNCIVYMKPRYLKRWPAIRGNTSSKALWRCTVFSRCFKKGTPMNIDLNQLDEVKESESQLESTAKLTKSPGDIDDVVVLDHDSETFDNQTGGSKLHRSVLNSSMLGEDLRTSQRNSGQKS